MDKKRPERTCVGCRQTGTKKELIRVVKTPDQRVTVDRNGKASGRGAYLCMDPECLKKARKPINTSTIVKNRCFLNLKALEKRL